MACTGLAYLSCVVICTLVFAGTVTLHALSWFHTDTTEGLCFMFYIIDVFYLSVPVPVAFPTLENIGNHPKYRQLHFFEPVINVHFSALLTDLFDFERDDLWELHHVDYFPTKWLSYIWAAVYFTQLIWLLYAMTFICRHKDVSQLLCAVLPCGSYFLLVLTYGGISGWLFYWDRKPDKTEYAVVCLLGACVFCFLSLGAAISRLRSKHEEMRLEALCDLWAVRALVQNGIAGLAAWITVVLFHGVAVVMLEETSVELSKIQYVFIGILFIYALIWFAMDVVGDYTILVISPYLIIVATFVAMAIEGADDREGTKDDVRFIMCIALGVVVVVLLLLKLAISCGREKRIIAIERRASKKMLQNGSPGMSI